MKVLLVIPAIGSVYGGPSKSVLELAQALGRFGINVDIITTTANGSTSLDVPTQTWIVEKYYRIQYFAYWDFKDYKFSWSLTRWLLLHVTDYDLVHTNAIFSYPVLPAHWACWLREVPYIMTPHGMLEPWALAYKSGKKGLYFSWFEKPALQRASAIQMLASSEAKRIEPLRLKAPLVLIPNGVHPHDFEKLPNAELFYHNYPYIRDKTLIIFLGRIDPKKGIDLLSVVFAKVHQRFPQTHLVIAGPDNTGFSKTATKYFLDAGCLDAVTFTGMLTGSLKYAALAAASIYVAPSYSEGFSISVLEGMATKLPCVITTGCNFPEAAAAQAALVVDIDVDKIAEALIWCLENPEQAKVMGDRAQKLILEHYTWEQIANKLKDVYTRITNEHLARSSLQI
ncbi:MAG: glycosyltransferase [Aphanocapsa sp. GSE-SYN-MK-11-07L]|jgi:glycosyltransferase involved in cell wall biosynthesis|nr:glycosyltransferase [Aphanocapsa sp. GSE-SYN-MK-11-07L]